MTSKVRTTFGALAVLWLGAGVAIAAGDGARLVSLPGQVRAFVDGELSARPVTDPPPEADLREMRLSMAEGGGYTATLTFAADDWKQISTFGGQRATHQVFVSLQPPTGARMRVHRDSEGVTTLDRADGDRFVRVGDAVARIDGPSVLFEIAPSVGMTADWEVQGHAFVRNAVGAGVHSHTAQVRAGSLTGEDGRILRLPAAGTRLDRENVPLLWQERAPMPAGTRPVSVAITRRTGGLSIDVTMDAPPAPATLDDGPAAAQVIALVIGAPGPGSYTLLYNPVERSAFGAIDGGAAGLLDDDVVVVEGAVVRFRVPEISGGRALGPIDGAAPVAHRAPLAQSSAPTDAPTDAPSQSGPPPPAVGPDTDLSVGAIVVSAQGGVAIETPVVPAGSLLPEAPASGGSDVPVIPILVGAALVVVVLLGRRMMIAREAPSVLELIEDDDPRDAKRDCSELEEEVARLREELERAKGRVAQAEADEDAADTSLEFFGELADIAGAVKSDLGADAVQWDRERVVDEVERRAAEADDEHERTEMRKDRVRDIERKLEEAERRLRDCYGPDGPPKSSIGGEPTVLDDIEEVPGPFV